MIYRETYRRRRNVTVDASTRLTIPPPPPSSSACSPSSSAVPDARRVSAPLVPKRGGGGRRGTKYGVDMRAGERMEERDGGERWRRGDQR